MIRVFQVFEHQFPVRIDALAHVAEHFQLAAVEYAIEITEHVGAEIFLERLHRLIEGGEDHAVAFMHLELLRAVLFEFEVRTHAALALVAPPERHAAQIALEVVGPLMIGAHEAVGVAVIVLDEGRRAVGATVDEHVGRAVLAARDHHRLVADVGANEIAGVRNLGAQRDIVPVRAAENLGLLLLIDIGIAINP